MAEPAAKKELEALIEAVTEVTPHNKALYESGKKLLIDSIDTGREFCKFMTTTTMSAIPIYIALLQLFLPKEKSLIFKIDAIFLLPALGFLTSSIIFIVGYFPGSTKLSLDLPDEISRAREIIITRRQRWSIVGFIIFSISLLFASWVLIYKSPQPNMPAAPPAASNSTH